MPRAAALSDDADCLYSVKPAFRQGVTFKVQDARELGENDGMEAGNDIVICRNSVFMYLSAECRKKVLKRIWESLNARGYLIIGLRDRLPDSEALPTRMFQPVYGGHGMENLGVYCKVSHLTGH